MSAWQNKVRWADEEAIVIFEENSQILNLSNCQFTYYDKYRNIHYDINRYEICRYGKSF